MICWRTLELCLLPSKQRWENWRLGNIGQLDKKNKRRKSNTQQRWCKIAQNHIKLLFFCERLWIGLLHSEFPYIFLGLWMARFCSSVGEVTRSQDAWISRRVLDCMRNLYRNLLDIVAGTAWQLLFAGRQKRLIPQPWWNWHLLMAPWQKSHSLLTAQRASCSTFPCKHLIDIPQILSVFITWHPSANCIKLRSKPFLLWTIQFYTVWGLPGSSVQHLLTTKSTGAQHCITKSQHRTDQWSWVARSPKWTRCETRCDRYAGRFWWFGLVPVEHCKPLNAIVHRNLAKRASDKVGNSPGFAFGANEAWSVNL